MLGYALFLIPTTVAFVWIKRKHGIEQALLDIYAFHLMFNFGFASLLPGSVNVELVHVLLALFVGYKGVKVILSGKVRTSHYVISLVILAGGLSTWMVFATWINLGATKAWYQILVYVVRLYVVDVFAIFIGIDLADEKRLKRFVKIFLFACVVDSIVAIIQMISGGTILTSDKGDYYLGIFQPLGSKFIQIRDLNESAVAFVASVRTIQFGSLRFYRGWGTYDGAMVGLMISVIVIVCLLTSKQRKSPSLLWFVLLICFSGVVVAFFRTGILTIILVSMAIIFIRFPVKVRRNSFLRIVFFIALMGIFLLSVVTLVEPVRRVLAANIDGFLGVRGYTQLFTLHGRTSLWQYALKRIAQSPIIGTGEAITRADAQWGSGEDTINISAHNVLLEFAYSGGLLPAFIYFYICLFCIFRLIKLIYNKRLSSAQRLICFTTLASFLTLLMTHFIGSEMKVPQKAMMFWILCGIAAAYKPMAKGNSNLTIARKEYVESVL